MSAKYAGDVMYMNARHVCNVCGCDGIPNWLASNQKHNLLINTDLRMNTMNQEKHLIQSTLTVNSGVRQGTSGTSAEVPNVGL